MTVDVVCTSKRGGKVEKESRSGKRKGQDGRGVREKRRLKKKKIGTLETETCEGKYGIGMAAVDGKGERGLKTPQKIK